jgi:putative flippase GtrA
MSELRELGAALATAALALGVDASILYGLTAGAHWHYLVAASCGFAGGTLVAWRLSVRFVFRYRRYRSQRRELLLFALIGILGLILNDLVIATVVERLGWHYLAGKACAALVTFGCNFSLRRLLLFSQPGLALRQASAR